MVSGKCLNADGDMEVSCWVDPFLDAHHHVFIHNFWIGVEACCQEENRRKDFHMLDLNPNQKQWQMKGFRFVGIPCKKCSSPGVDWNPGWGVDANHMFSVEKQKHQIHQLGLLKNRTQFMGRSNHVRRFAGFPPFAS